MIVTNILGGLGNQMFQYAIGRSLSLRNGHELKLDITEFDHYKLRSFDLNLFDIESHVASKDEINSLEQEFSKSASTKFFGLKGVAEPVSVLASKYKELIIKKEVYNKVVTIAGAI